MEKEIILVVGYPKSGTTWLTRLVAELIGCPVKGFFGQPKHKEIAIGRFDRVSKYLVFKGHHPFHKVSGKIGRKNLIYIVRDVRDIAISGAYYFRFFGFPLNNIVGKFFRKIPVADRLSYRWFSLRTEQKKIVEMIRTLDKGNNSLSWCNIPWDEHVREYLRQEVLIIRYEDLLSRPFCECKKILSHLGIERNDNRIYEAVKNQNFETVRKKFLVQVDTKQLKLLREGTSGGWKRKLAEEQQRFLKNRFFDTLKLLDYIDDSFEE